MRTQIATLVLAAALLGVFAVAAPVAGAARADAIAGTYVGKTSQGFRITFTVAPDENDVVGVTRVSTFVTVVCDDGSERTTSVRLLRRAPITLLGSFTAIPRVGYTVRGRFPRDGVATGTISVVSYTAVSASGSQRCVTAKPVTWSATLVS